MSTELTLNYNIDGASIGNIAVDYDLSRMNHRIYRQSNCYYGTVSLEKLGTNTEVKIYTLHNGWQTKNAYRFAMQHYMDSRAAELQEAGNNKARWNDFRVSPGHSSGNWIDPQDPIAFSIAAGVPAPASYTAGEYLYSRSPDSAGNDKGYSWDSNGALATTTHHPFTSAWDIMDEYAKPKNTQADPENVNVDVAFADSDFKTETSLDEGELDDVLGDGNEPPYNADNLIGERYVLRAILGGATGSDTERLSTGLIPIPCGIVVFENSAGASIRINMKPGEYKGVHVESWSVM